MVRTSPTLQPGDGSRARKYLPHRHLDARRAEWEGAVVHGGGQDRAVGLAAVVQQRRAVGLDDQVMVHPGRSSR